MIPCDDVSSDTRNSTPTSFFLSLGCGEVSQEARYSRFRHEGKVLYVLRSATQSRLKKENATTCKPNRLQSRWRVHVSTQVRATRYRDRCLLLCKVSRPPLVVSIVFARGARVGGHLGHVAANSVPKDLGPLAGNEQCPQKAIIRTDQAPGDGISSPEDVGD